MIFKSFIIEKKIELLDAYNLTLIYGENEGIKTILREKIKNRNKNIEIIKHFSADKLLGLDTWKSYCRRYNDRWGIVDFWKG